MRNRHNKYLRVISSGLIVILVAIGAVITFTSTKEGLLTARGLQNLKYFTVDSNLFLGLVCLVDVIAALIDLEHEKGPGSVPAARPLLELLRYTAVVAVTLTFTVVAVFFGPGVGYGFLYRDANLFFHLIIPVLGLLSFAATHRELPASLRPIPLWETLLALAPSVVYGVYYTVVLLVRGVHFPDTDWYGFAAGGVRGSMISAVGVLLATWLLALGVRLLAGGHRARGQGGAQQRDGAA